MYESLRSLLLLLIVLAGRDHRHGGGVLAQNDNFPDSLSVILSQPFSCAASCPSPITGSLNWCTRSYFSRQQNLS